MAFTERIAVILDLQKTGFKAGLTNIRSELAAAEGFFGKFKAGASGAMGLVKQNAGLMAVGAGAAITAFGVKAVSDFTGVAKAALDLGKATGLSTEQASRWIAVGDDMEVSADQLTAGIGRIGKTLDSGKWEKYGIATRDASGEARDANDILLDTFVMLGRVGNETERSKRGNELFGKGYANLVPIIGHTRAEYESWLASVEDGQVITDGEAAKAEKMRLAQDKLSDAFREISLTVGEALTSLAPLVDLLADGIGLIEPLSKGITGLSGPLLDLAEANGVTVENLIPLATTIDAVTTAFKENHGVVADVVMGEYDAAAAAKEHAVATAGLAGAIIGAMDAAQRAARAIDDLKVKQLAARKTAADYQAELDAMDDRYDELGVIIPKVAKATRDQTDATDDGTTAEERHYKALGVTRDVLAKLRDLESGRANDALKSVDAHLAYSDALIELAGSLDEYKTTTKHSAEETADMRNEIIDAAKDFGGLEGAADGSKDSIDRQIASLEGTADTLAPGSPLRRQLEEYIAALKKIPTTVATNVVLGAGASKTSGGAKGGGLPPGFTQIAGLGLLGSGAGLDDEARKATEREDDIQAAMLETGRISRDTYRTYLQERIKQEQDLSDEWLTIWRKLGDLDAQQGAEIHDAQDRDQEQANKTAEDAEQAHQDRLTAIIAKAHAQRDFDEAAREVDAAMAKVAWWANDPNATGADRAGAAEGAAEALFRRASSGAQLAGFKTDSPEWAAAVRAALLGDLANAPALEEAIRRILVGVPSFANGGVMPGPRGQHALALVAGGETISNGGGGAMYFDFRGAVGVDGPAVERWVVRTIKDYKRRGGQL